MDVTFRVQQTKDGLVITRLHPELPADEMFSDFSVDSVELMFAIRGLSIFEFTRQQRQEAEHRQEIDERRRRSSYYPYRDKLLKDLPKKQGVYLIRCAANDCTYVGASRNIKTRVKTHLDDMTKNPSPHPMAQDVQEYGFETITVSVLELVADKAQLSEREQHWIREFDSIESGYNKSMSHAHHSWAEDDEQ
jgi:hypothetical protein